MEKMNCSGVKAGWTRCRQYRGHRIAYQRSWRGGRMVGMLVLLHLLSLLIWPLTFGVDSARAQEASAGTVAIVDVNDQSFPTVSLFMDVADANGAPVAGLAPANFTVTEDGQPATIQNVTVDSSQPLALLLALDRSTDATTWAAVQGAAAAILNALGPEDQVAITSVFEEVQTVQEFSTNKDAALAALAGVTPGGQFSAINPAFIDAVGRFNDDLPARRAIILVADAPDNISTVSADQVVAQVSGQGTPIYVVGYGERVQNEPTFSQIAEATGGRFFGIGAANDLQTSLTSLLPQLRQGYRLDFLSTITADNLPHTAQVTVVAPNVNGSATAEFVARPSTIEVTLPGLAAGQPVAGVVNLMASAALSGTVTSVEFLVDGVSVGTATDLTTPVALDTSTLTPGPHQLTVVVTDSVGNQGEASVEILIPESSARVDLLAVDYSRFPTVTSFVDAFGNNGLPLTGLNSQSFTVSEDNRPVDPAQVAVSVDATQPLNMVLVLDRSVPVAEWAQLRNAANGLVDSLRPEDQMAVYSFAGSPTLVQAVTGDKNVLKGALATIEPVPPAPETTPPTPSTDNGLHQALLDSTNLAATLPEGRRAVVALTNSADNTGQIALPDLISTLESQSIPVHLLAFDVDGQSAGVMAAISQVAGGNSVAVNGAADVLPALQTLTSLLQQGYRLDFTSGLQADDTSHELAIGLSEGGLEATTAGEFIARSRPITVTFPNVVDGSTVSGALNLTAQADAPAPITSVVYRLNGDVLAEVDDTTFSIVWNSDTVEPGPYTVDVEVVDAAGNQGTATVSFDVVAPVTVAASLAPGNSDGDIVVGDEVTIDAEATAYSGDPRVEFYVDRELISTDTQPPYSATFDSEEFGAGDHAITVIARDDDGHEATSTLDVALVAPPPPTPQATPTTSAILPAIPTMAAVSSLNWWRILTWTGIFATAVVALLLMLSSISNARRSAVEQKLMPMRVTLSNIGNVATGYLLRGEDPAGILNFRFSMNGVVLGLPPVARLTEDAVVPGAAPGAGRPTFPGMQMPQGNAGDGTGPDIEGMADTLEEASAVGSIIASILLTIAALLPNSLGSPIRMVAMQIRKGQMLANRVKSVRRQVDRLNKTEMGRQVVQGTANAAGQVGQAATSDATRASVSQGASGAGAMFATATTRTVNKMYDLTGQGKGTTQGSNGFASPSGPRQWVYLPPIAPGETVSIDVMVGASANKISGDHQRFRILSRALGEENAQPVVEEGSIKIKKASPWPSITRYIFAGIVLLVAIAVIWLLVGALS